MTWNWLYPGAVWIQYSLALFEFSGSGDSVGLTPPPPPLPLPPPISLSFKFHYPRVSLGDQPLTKSRRNSGLEIFVLVLVLLSARAKNVHNFIKETCWRSCWIINLLLDGKVCIMVEYFHLSLVFWLSLRTRQNTAWLAKTDMPSILLTSPSIIKHIHVRQWTWRVHSAFENVSTWGPHRETLRNSGTSPD